MKGKTRKALFTVLLIFLFVGNATVVQAYEVIDINRNDCSLTIEMKYDGKQITGGELTLYRVGNFVERSDRKLYLEWKQALNCTVSMENVETAEAAEKVMKCVKCQNIEGTTVNIVKDGKAIFKNLEVGLYLVEQKTAAEGYTAITPFLILIPQWEDNHYNYAVTATAKYSVITEEVSNDNKNLNSFDNLQISSQIKLPQTGQLNWPIPVFLTFGVILLITGCVLRRNKQDE